MKLIRILALLCLLFILPSFDYAIAQKKENYYFYRPIEYGSELMFNPVSALLNGGLDVLQSYNSSTRAKDINWKIGATSVWHSIKSPLYWINNYGWKKFLSQEVLPTSLDITRAQWVPNYALHLFCGGMEYRKLSEWFDYHKFPFPYLLGGITAMGYHFFNEVVENGPCIHGNVDAIADLCIFDPLGILLFSFDDVADFFSNKLYLNDWSPQPSVSLNPLAFRNFSHSFSMKLPLNATRRLNFFAHLGKTTLAGFSVKASHDEFISVGFGATQTGVWEVDETNGIPTYSIYIGASAGFFLDRNNSLLASLIIADYNFEFIRLNIYPGALFLAPYSPGFFLVVSKKGVFALGVTTCFSPVGLSIFVPHR